jgi:transcriptional regulator with XRE-family HTH domain
MTDADRLRAILADAGLSQSEAARRLGITDRTMRRYCAGDSPVHKIVWLALGSVLGVAGDHYGHHGDGSRGGH